MPAVSLVATQSRVAIWPVLVAPFVTGIYYLAIKGAFAESIVSVLGQTSATDIDLADIAGPHWGSHWIYRSIAEIISVGFATFVAAGLAHGRERVAAITGGCTISLGFLARIAMLLYAWKYTAPEEYSVPEPWYQYGIEALMVFAAPIVGGYVAEAAEDLHQEAPAGFGGVARGHFIWLWVPTFWYARGLITPMARIYALGPDAGPIAAILTLLVNGIPAAAIAIPGYFGLALLGGQLGSHLSAAVRNILGTVVLILGFAVGLALQLGWYWLAQTIYKALFG
jgi:hypothetical protein